MLVNPEAFGNLLALQAIGAQQDHPASVRQRTRRPVPPDLSFEKASLLLAQHDQIRLSPRHPEHSCLPDKSIYNAIYFSSR
jgi:hypothetical protein